MHRIHNPIGFLNQEFLSDASILSRDFDGRSATLDLELDLASHVVDKERASPEYFVDFNPDFYTADALERVRRIRVDLRLHGVRESDVDAMRGLRPGYFLTDYRVAGVRSGGFTLSANSDRIRFYRAEIAVQFIGYVDLANGASL